MRGGTDDSYGIDVSRLAGIPEDIIQRAQQILKQLESGAPVSYTHLLSENNYFDWNTGELQKWENS